MNIRQSGRSRGRRNNNNRSQNGMRGGDQGSRIDNRARGNAVQLHEKYKNMARDAQLQGDRVMSEYYNQFADHYFRVLSEHRARQEEQQAQARARYAEDYGDEGDYTDGDMTSEGQMTDSGANEHASAEDGPSGDGDDQNYGNHAETQDDGPDRYRSRGRDTRRTTREGGRNSERGQDRDRRPQREGRPDARRNHRVVEDSDVPESLDIAALPPALSQTLNSEEEIEAKPKPKLRPRKPRATASDAAEAPVEI
jgi:Domain of unknown function (DUF4167)